MDGLWSHGALKSLKQRLHGDLTMDLTMDLTVDLIN
jgi:hypothetical protein